MLEKLDRVSNRTAYGSLIAGLAVSFLGALLVPREETLGEWIRLVIWHGMLKWACIVAILLVGVLAVLRLAIGRERLDKWARALQLVLLPAWAIAVVIGAIAAKVLWGAWNLAERRMTMSLLYTVVAAVAVIIELVWQGRPAGTVGRVVTAAAMGVGLVWLAVTPTGTDVHPGAAIWSSGDVAFMLYALMMMAGCLLAVLAAAVPVHRWLGHMGADSGVAEA